MSLRTLEAQGADGHEEEHAHQTVSMQYENIEQQNETYIVGMWSFLVTEIMFFGALFLIYSLYRVMFFNTYLEAHQFLNVTWGTVNTTVLLLSSWSMVMAVGLRWGSATWTTPARSSCCARSRATAGRHSTGTCSS